jgi:hypothetical protein
LQDHLANGAVGNVGSISGATDDLHKGLSELGGDRRYAGDDFAFGWEEGRD